MPSDPLTSTEGLEVGQVVIVAKKLRSKQGGEEYWWKTFRVITKVGSWMIETLILKMVIDPDKDKINIMIGRTNSDEIVTLLNDREIPQGPSAMLMKHIALGTIKLNQ